MSSARSGNRVSPSNIADRPTMQGTRKAIAASGVPFAIGHAPGHMLITDAPNASYQVP